MLDLPITRSAPAAGFANSIFMLIMVVFDPLAVLLLIAANISMMDKRKMQYCKQEPTPEAYVADVGEPPKEEQKQVEEEKTPVTKLKIGRAHV